MCKILHTVNNCSHFGDVYHGSHFARVSKILDTLRRGGCGVGCVEESNASDLSLLLLWLGVLKLFVGLLKFFSCDQNIFEYG